MITEEEFFQRQPLAIFGVSTRGKSFGNRAYRELINAGVTAYAINPKGGSLGKCQLFPSLDRLPEPARAAVILTKGDGAVSAVNECSGSTIEWVWLQGGSDTEEVRKLCDDLGLKRHSGTCILMRNGRFPHNLHRFFHDLFKRKRGEGN
jgi:predicted CoA-binding protein